MKLGTRSLLYGAHCWCIHPWFVARAWWKLFGFPIDPRLWLCFWLHDLGYWGKRAMDDAEGERHVEWAAAIMGNLFGPVWRDMCLYHSRFYAKRDGKPFSRLCVADKLAIALTPAWLYLPMARMSGEIHEYMELAKMRTAMGEPKYASMRLTTGDQKTWFADMREYLRRWVAEHADGKEDKWTPSPANRA